MKTLTGAVSKQRFIQAAMMAALALLAACAEKPPVTGKGADPFAPNAFNQGKRIREDSVDGLIVGHRLMESGEYELALKAYLRAAGDLGTNADVLSALGSVNLKLGRLGQSEDLLRKAIKKNESFVPAWNNLGVVLMERGKTAEAAQVFRTAFALDSGNSDEIRENLTRALAQIENPAYSSENEDEAFDLVRRGNGRFLLLAKS